ncbi:MAG: GHMP kinase [Planctomycetota bacterium]
MLLIRKRAHARAGLLGNPSDGYNGKTISIIIRNYWAEVVVYEWEDVELLWTQEERHRFRSVHDLVRDVKLHGYYGGLRLIKATIKKFVEYCERVGIHLDDRNFTARYETNIPRQVGMAGSSAIIVATLRCLMEFYGVRIPLEVQPTLACSVETEELGIAAGLQDRVIQVYEGVVYMDFCKEAMHEVNGLSCGKYERIAPSLLPPIYVAYSVDVSEPTELFHNDLRSRYQRGEPEVLAAMKKFASIAEKGKAMLESGDHQTFSKLVNENFDTRRQLCRLPPGQVAMIDRAREVGASAKFAGSGGAIIGTYEGEAMFRSLQTALGAIGCRVIKPNVEAGNLSG